MAAPTSPDPRPLRADAERNRRRLLEAAGELFAAKGLGVGLDEIARHAGVGVGTAYRRFKDKDELIEALFAERIDAFAALAEQALADPDPWTGFAGFMEGAVRLQVADRGLKEALFRAKHRVHCMDEARDRVAPLIEAIVARVRDSGRLRPDVEVTDVALVQFLVSAVADLGKGPDLAVRYLTIMLDGLRTREPSPLPSRAMTREELEALHG